MEKEHNLLESDVVTLTLDDDVEIECAIITTFNMDSTEYIALLPLDENGQNQSGETVEMRTETYGSIALSVIPQAAPIMIFKISKMMMSMTALRISLMNGLIHRNLKALILKNNYFIL